MKICFLQKQMFPYLGVTALSGALLKAGHETDLLINAREPDIIAALKETGADIVGFSVLSSEHSWLKEVAARAKEAMPDVPIIVGGVHAVLYPKEIMKIKEVDYVCLGEGEVPLPALMDSLAAGSSAKGIAGIGYRDDTGVHLHNTAPLTEDLNTYVEDRSVYYNRYKELRDMPLKYFLASRGCPYKCTFCANTYLMETFKESGKYIRFKSPRHLVDEVKSVVGEFGASAIVFSDDLFVGNLQWLTKFAAIYKAEVELPFFCTVRSGSINEKHAELLAESGCSTASTGVETGSEHLRQKILNKTVSNDEIRRTVELLKSKGIRIQTSNMFCLPGETVEDAISTIDFNISLGVNFTFNLIFLPYPKTELADYCISHGMLDKDYTFDDMPESFIVDSVLKLENKTTLTNIHKVAYFCIRFPRTKSFLLFLTKFGALKPLLFFVYLAGTLIRYKDEKNLTYLQAIRFLWSFRKGC